MDQPWTSTQERTRSTRRSFDKALLIVAGLHKALPTITLVQRLVVGHLKEDIDGKVWGRRFPGAGPRKPPIADPKEKGY